MAKLIPSLDKIMTMKTKPEEGELYLLNFLNRELDSSFEVYFNPFMNGDRPDIIIMRKGYGVMIIEVKDYNLDLYELDNKKNFVIKSNQTKTYKSPINQVLRYKKNLYELHIDKLLEKKIKDIRNFNIVSSVVYFHNATPAKINNFLIDPFKEDYGYQKFLRYNIDFIGRDENGDLKGISVKKEASSYFCNISKKKKQKKIFATNISNFNDILTKHYLISNQISILFTDEIYHDFKRFLKPPIHLKENGKVIPYSKKQMEIIYDSTRKQQRIKGVMGSGKTTVLAARAVQAHKRTNGNILILTYNITLKNYIKDKISDVREEFPWENFVILNYHLFINSQLNNLSIPFELPEDFDQLNETEKNAFLEKKYYSNKKLFLDRKEDIKTFDVILIDEIQDYKRTWMEIIKECFLSKNGEYVLFGDVKQNIYNNKTEGKDISTNVRGVTELKNCFRSEFKIKDLAVKYQKDIFKNKYEIDSFNTNQSNLTFEKQGNINYIHLTNTDSVTSLYTIVHQNAINKDIPPNDITILGHSISLLKKFDTYYRYSSNERTNTMFETSEMVYRMGLNYIKKNNHPSWLKEGITLIKRQNDYKTNKAFDQLSILFTIYDLYKEYGDKFKNRLDYYTSKFKTSTINYLAFRKKFEPEINDFIKDFGPKRQTSNLKTIRDNKKIHFYMNSGTVKISTIHSFKGWESETLFLILEKKHSQAQMTFDEVLYTGITRSKANLVIINFGNEEYHNKLKTLVNKVN